MRCRSVIVQVIHPVGRSLPVDRIDVFDPPGNVLRQAGMLEPIVTLFHRITMRPVIGESRHRLDVVPNGQRRGSLERSLSAPTLRSNNRAPRMRVILQAALRAVHEARRSIGRIVYSRHAIDEALNLRMPELLKKVAEGHKCELVSHTRHNTGTPILLTTARMVSED